MPNQRSAEKTCISAWVLESTKFKLKKKAKLLNETLQNYIQYILMREVANVELTYEEQNEVCHRILEKIGYKNPAGNHGADRSYRKKGDAK